MMENPDNLCPNCKHDFGKPVKAKRVCPACKNTIVIRGGRPVTEAKAQKIDEKREAAREADYQRWARKINRAAAAATIRNLKNDKRNGIATVVLHSSSDCCEECKAMDGKIFDIDAALQDPPVPVKTCTSDFCRCSVDSHSFKDPVTQSYFESLRKPTSGRRSSCLVCLLSGLTLTVLATYILVHLTP